MLISWRSSLALYPRAWQCGSARGSRSGQRQRVPVSKWAPFSVDGVFRSDAICFEINPVT